MPQQIPCLWFDGRAEEAAAHYTSIFPNSGIGDITRHGPGMPMPEGSVMTVSFTLDGQEYVGLNGGPEFSFSEAISFQIITDGQEETDHYWDRLTDGGEEGPCGWLKDRFGVSWQVVPKQFFALMQDADPGRARRAGEALFQMKRIVIADLERAADTVPA